MKKVAILLIAIFASSVLLAIGAFFAYDAFVFQPHRAEISEILSQAPPEDREPPPKIRRYISASHQTGSPPSVSVARILVVRFLPDDGNIRWHSRNLLWDALVRLHFSQDEIVGLYSTLSYNGHGIGLSSLSNHLFSKPLSSLNDQEAATVVAYIRAPIFYANHPDLLASRRALLLSRASSGP